MAEFSTVMRELYRMCGSFATCEGGCPLNEWHGNACYEDCYQAVKNQPEEAEKIIVRWTTEHPAETRLQKFLSLIHILKVMMWEFHLVRKKQESSKCSMNDIF